MVLLLIQPTVTTALPAPELTLEEKIDYYAETYGVSASLMHHIISRESGYNPDIIGDVNYRCKRTGEIAPSRGLVQINKCFWPEEYEQAEDPDFALEFLAFHLSQGKCYYWSTCPKGK